MKPLEQTREEAKMLDDYSHLTFRRANSRFEKYKNAPTFVVNKDGERQEVKTAQEQVNMNGQTKPA